MMRKMLTLKRFSKDVGELMNDAHVFYNEATKDGRLSDDEDEHVTGVCSNVSVLADPSHLSSNLRSRKLSLVSGASCPWKQTQRGSRKRKIKGKDVSRKITRIMLINL